MATVSRVNFQQKMTFGLEYLQFLLQGSVLDRIDGAESDQARMVDFPKMEIDVAKEPEQ
ncbi:hypothetical protein BaRGS_00032170, partial [Batillaria attramentaria]